jgi:hypothetical protein
VITNNICSQTAPTLFAEGGGIAANGSALVITGNTISGNKAYSGAGVSASSYPSYKPIVIRDNTITNNRSYLAKGQAGTPEGTGGGISCRYCKPTIDNNFIGGNTAVGNGAGIDLNSTPPKPPSPGTRSITTLF